MKIFRKINPIQFHQLFDMFFIAQLSFYIKKRSFNLSFKNKMKI